MSTLIAYADGVVVDISGEASRASLVSSAMAAEVSKPFASAVSTIGKVIGPAVSGVRDAMACYGISELQLEVSLMFSAEGNLYLCKSSTEGAMKLSATIKGSQ